VAAKEDEMSKKSGRQFWPIYLLFCLLAFASAVAASPLSALRSGTEKIASSTVHVTKKIVEVPVRAVQDVKNAF
jgi:hypothetical protein